MTTYEQVVCLSLNRKRAGAELARAVKIGMDVANGRLGPLEWYALDCDDVQEAKRKYDEAMLRAVLQRRQ